MGALRNNPPRLFGPPLRRGNWETLSLLTNPTVAKSCTKFKPCWHLQGNHHPMESDRWCEMDFATIHRMSVDTAPLRLTGSRPVPSESVAPSAPGSGHEARRGEAVHRAHAGPWIGCNGFSGENGRGSKLNDRRGKPQVLGTMCFHFPGQPILEVRFFGPRPNGRILMKQSKDVFLEVGPLRMGGFPFPSKPAPPVEAPSISSPAAGGRVPKVPLVR